ncbi:MAG: hypothetical protein EOO61_02255 [Hymenobacter sp.]|nr:MAG: hypothetical protein EOO61_02255 [Hymenobacter sp.]
MEVCCTEEFKQEIEKLRKNGSYANIESVLADAYCDVTFEQANTGDLLGVMPGMNYLKKRLEGSGGYRFYLLAIVKGEKIYLGFVHPKAGRYGGDNVTPEKKKSILKELLAAIKSQQLYRIERDNASTSRVRFLVHQPQNRT